LEQVVWAYRGAVPDRGRVSRLTGKTLSLSPMYLQQESRMVGLVMLLSVVVRLLSLLEFQVRQKLAEGSETLRGIYPGRRAGAATGPARSCC